MLARTAEKVRAWNRRRLKARKERRKKPYMLGLLAIMKNESMNLVEWIEHYKWQGVEQFYLIDNGSTDNTLELVQPYINEGLVKLLVLTKPWSQTEHYHTAFKRLNIKKNVDWLIMADLDEFWFSKQRGVSMRDALHEFNQVDVIYANWAMFGSSGYVQHPPSLRRCLTKRQPFLSVHENTKWICRTKSIRTPKALAVHKIIGGRSERTVSDNHTFQLNHYPIQSVEYFEKVKMVRGDALNAQMNDIRNKEYFRCYDEPATLTDTTLADLLE